VADAVFLEEVAERRVAFRIVITTSAGSTLTDVLTGIGSFQKPSPL